MFFGKAKGKVIAALLLPCCLLCSLPATAMSLSAESAVLYEPQTKSVLYEQNAMKRRGMASTTKIMTALVAAELGNPADIIEIGRDSVGIEGSSLYLKEGEQYTLESLLYGLMLQSANDAATAIALHIGGSIEGFAAMMNRKVEALGLHDTHFENPHGLDHRNHYTTALDLAVISAAALQNPTVAQIVATKSHTISTVDGARTVHLVNHNKMLRLYRDAVGVKTGFTKKCGRCLVTAAERDGLLLISVTLNAPSDWQDHRNLLDYGFSKYTCVTLDRRDDVGWECPVFGSDSEAVYCGIARDAKCVLPAEHGKIRRDVVLGAYLTAPVRRGDIVGIIRYFCDGREIASVDIIALSEARAAHCKKGLFGLFH